MKTMCEKRVLILLIGYCSSLVSAEGVNKEYLSVDMDYFFSSLRDNSCDSRDGLKNCKKVCNEVPILCHEGECYCHQSVLKVIKPQYETSLGLKQELQIKVKPQLEVKKKSSEITPETMLTYEALRPALRHHVAHFCPSLDVARKCIKKCMKTGKPAFCGKDHTCYCGHKYSSHDSKDEKNALDTYKEFADMYAKYLGNTDNDESVDDDNQSNASTT